SKPVFISPVWLSCKNTKPSKVITGSRGYSSSLRQPMIRINPEMINRIKRNFVMYFSLDRRDKNTTILPFMKLGAAFVQDIFKLKTARDFESLALELFRYQY